MIKPIIINERETFHQLVYNLATLLKEHTIRVYCGSTTTREATQRTTTLTLALDAYNRHIEYKRVQVEDIEDVRTKDTEVNKLILSEELSQLQEYLSSASRKTPLPTHRENLYLVITTIEGLEATLKKD